MNKKTQGVTKEKRIHWYKFRTVKKESRREYLVASYKTETQIRWTIRRQNLFQVIQLIMKPFLWFFDDFCLILTFQDFFHDVSRKISHFNMPYKQVDKRRVKMDCCMCRDLHFIFWHRRHYWLYYAKPRIWFFFLFFCRWGIFTLLWLALCAFAILFLFFFLFICNFSVAWVIIALSCCTLYLI